MASSGIGGTLTSGIQDISALLPLLGTEQCEVHIGSVLTEGYLYAAATPMSIFGSLGMASAGFKTFLACISIPAWNIVGAQKLRGSLDSKRKGLTCPLLRSIERRRDNHVAEIRLTSLLDSLHLENVDDLTIATGLEWNVKMFCLTAFLCALSILPYVHLNILGDSYLHPFVRWAFPMIRALGGFITATTIQIAIQIRLSIIMEKHLLFLTLDQYEDLGIDQAIGTYTALEPRLWELENDIDKQLRQMNPHNEGEALANIMQAAMILIIVSFQRSQDVLKNYKG